MRRGKMRRNQTKEAHTVYAMFRLRCCDHDAPPWLKNRAPKSESTRRSPSMVRCRRIITQGRKRPSQLQGAVRLGPEARSATIGGAVR
eukprot:583937-Pyramimonas_sp.AAC.1